MYELLSHLSENSRTALKNLSTTHCIRKSEFELNRADLDEMIALKLIRETASSFEGEEIALIITGSRFRTDGRQVAPLSPSNSLDAALSMDLISVYGGEYDIKSRTISLPGPEGNSIIAVRSQGVSTASIERLCHKYLGGKFYRERFAKLSGYIEWENICEIIVCVPGRRIASMRNSLKNLQALGNLYIVPIKLSTWPDGFYEND